MIPTLLILQIPSRMGHKSTMSAALGYVQRSLQGESIEPCITAVSIRWLRADGRREKRGVVASILFPGRLELETDSTEASSANDSVRRTERSLMSMRQQLAKGKDLGLVWSFPQDNELCSSLLIDSQIQWKVKEDVPPKNPDQGLTRLDPQP